MSKADDISDSGPLDRLIVAYLNARTAWLATATSDDDLLSQGAHFEAVEAAGVAIIHYPCLTLADLRKKVAFLLSMDELYTMVREDEDHAGDLLRTFLSSLITPIPASKSNR